MKIHPDQLEGIRPDQTSTTNKPRSASTAFGDLLTEEVAKSGTESTQTAATLPPPGGLGTLGDLGALGSLMGAQTTASTTGVEATAQVPQAEKAIMETVENLLDKWDVYAKNLQGSPNSASLKQAYGVLDDIDGTVQKLKGDNPNLAATNPAMQGVVSELEVMAVTERIKFNRGDYTA
jgi:hypothetical protein